MNRVVAIRRILDRHPKAAVIFCNGLNSREASHAAHRPGNLYLLHGMGEALSVGIGLRAARPDLDVVVIDGDGNAAMGMAEWVLLPQPGLSYYVLVNRGYETTGGQEIPGRLRRMPGVTLVPIDRGTCRAPVPPLPESIKDSFVRWLKRKRGRRG